MIHNGIASSTDMSAGFETYRCAQPCTPATRLVCTLERRLSSLVCTLEKGTPLQSESCSGFS